MCDIQKAIDQIVKDVRDQTGVPGLAVCLAKGTDRWFAADGTARVGTRQPVARDARFDVSCLMKFFLSVTALRLQSAGDLDLRTDVAGILPELGPRRGISLTHLMSHTGGYHGLDITDMAVRWNSRWDSFSAYFRGAHQLFEPGTVFNYEHSEHVILGQALERRTGMGPSALVHHGLLSRAGIQLREAASGDPGISPHAYSAQRDGYTPIALPPFGAFWEASLPALTITLDDALTAVQAALGAEVIRQDLASPLIELPEMARSEPRAELPPRQFSAGCGIYPGGILGHNGSMFGQTVGFRADPRNGVAAIAGVNAYSAHARDTCLRRVLELFCDLPLAYRPPGEASPCHSHAAIFGELSLEDLPGRYAGSYLGELTVTRPNEGLQVTLGPPGARQSSFRIAAKNSGYTIESKTPVAMCFEQGADASAILRLGVHAYKLERGTPNSRPPIKNEARHGIGV